MKERLREQSNKEEAVSLDVKGLVEENQSFGFSQRTIRTEKMGRSK